MLNASPLVLPEFPPPLEGGPAYHYHYRPGEEEGRRMTEWLENVMGLERPPLSEQMPVSSVVEYQLSRFFSGSNIAQTLHFDLTEEAEIQNHLHTPEALMPDTLFTCYLSVHSSLVLHAYDFRQEVLESEDEEFAAALFFEVERAMADVTMTWGPYEAWEYLDERYYWGEGEHYRLDEYRPELAEERGVDEEEITYDDLREYCDGYFIMKYQVKEELPEVYSNYKFDCELPDDHENEKISQLLSLSKKLKKKGKAFNEDFGPQGCIWEASDHFHLPWSFVLNVEQEPYYNSFTRQLFEDNMEMHGQCSNSPAPEMVVGVDPDDEASLENFCSMLNRLRDVHELTQEILEIIDPVNFPERNELDEDGKPAEEKWLEENSNLRSSAPLPEDFVVEDPESGRPRLSEEYHEASMHVAKLAGRGNHVDTFPLEALAAFA